MNDNKFLCAVMHGKETLISGELVFDENNSEYSFRSYVSTTTDISKLKILIGTSTEQIGCLTNLKEVTFKTGKKGHAIRTIEKINSTIFSLRANVVLTDDGVYGFTIGLKNDTDKKPIEAKAVFSWLNN